MIKLNIAIFPRLLPGIPANLLTPVMTGTKSTPINAPIELFEDNDI
jgi:hypothetical protein